MHIHILSVVAGILSASHKIGRHVVTVSCVNETEHAEPITEQTVPAHNGRFLKHVHCYCMYKLLVETEQW